MEFAIMAKFLFLRNLKKHFVPGESDKLKVLASHYFMKLALELGILFS
jgi:hypothetical protein